MRDNFGDAGIAAEFRERAGAGDGFDAAGSAGYCGFADELEETDFAGGGGVRAAAELGGEVADADDADEVAVLFAEERCGAEVVDGLVDGDVDEGFDGRVGEDLRVDDGFDFSELFVGDSGEVREIEAEAVGVVERAGLKINRIVIDAGHGGHDSGTLGVGGIREKDVVLDVALRLGKLLHDRLGAEIVYTRSDDTFIPLETRTAIANKAQADLFISVHANSSPEPGVRGVEVYYLNFTSDPDAMRVAARENAVSNQSVHDLSDLVKKIALKDKIDESKELATDVDTSLYSGLTKGNASLHNRGVKKAPFVVLIGANMPSILAEISFVTNQQDSAQLKKPEYRERVAESLYAGVARYADAINGHKTRPAPTQRAAR